MGKYVMVGCCVDSDPEDWPTEEVAKMRGEWPGSDPEYFTLRRCDTLLEAQLEAVGLARDWFLSDIDLYVDAGEKDRALQRAASMPTTLALIATMEPGEVRNVTGEDWVRIEADDA